MARHSGTEREPNCHPTLFYSRFELHAPDSRFPETTDRRTGQAARHRPEIRPASRSLFPQTAQGRSPRSCAGAGRRQGKDEVLHLVLELYRGESLPDLLEPEAEPG